MFALSHAGKRWYAHGVPLKFLALVALVSGAPVVSGGAYAQAAERTGKQVVDAVCITCHGSGANGAPKIGDKKAWAPRADKGLTSLTASALSGIRKMPAHGGTKGVSDAEISLAIVYMVNESGGNWNEPTDRTKPAAQRSGQQVVLMQCAKCHESGAGGAPRIGDKNAWITRAKQGMDSLVVSAINGHGGMPARGGQANLTDAEIRAAVGYMMNPGGVTADPSAGTSAPDPNHKTVRGIEIYFGLIPAETLRARQANSAAPASQAIPSGANYYHVDVSVLDSATKLPIKDATIEASVADPLMGKRTKVLAQETFDNRVSYGNFLQIPGKDVQHITIAVRRPGTSVPIEANFDFKR